MFKAIASSLNCLVWASTDKQKTLRCIQDEEIQARLTSDKYSARVHVVPMMDLKPQVTMISSLYSLLVLLSRKVVHL